MNVSEKTLKTLEAVMKKEILIYGYKSNQIEKYYTDLISGKTVEVGYRSSCGSTDRTHKVFREWIKLIKCLKKDGFLISETQLKHDNKSPTSSQGFWNSIKYKISVQ